MSFIVVCGLMENIRRYRRPLNSVDENEMRRRSQALLTGNPSRQDGQSLDKDPVSFVQGLPEVSLHALREVQNH